MGKGSKKKNNDKKKDKSSAKNENASYFLCKAAGIFLFLSVYLGITS